MAEMQQISFFDLVLPGVDEIVDTTIEEAEEVIKEVSSSNQSDFSFAKVPDEEFQNNVFNKKDMPTVDSIIKKLQKDSYSVSTYELLSDVLECGAIAISNKFCYREDREEKYKATISKYDERTRFLIQEVFSDIYLLLTSQIYGGFNDYLGELFMKSDTSNKKTGQFFTPYCVSRCCAAVSISGNDIQKYIDEDKIITLNEPTCGAGGMIIAAVDVLYNQYHFNYSRNLLVECSDIDRRCVYMTYLQLACSGIPAIIYHRDTISMETWDMWETPAYLMQYSRFKDVLRVAK